MPHTPTTVERYLRVIESLQVAPNYQTAKKIRRMLEKRGDIVDTRTTQRILQYLKERYDLSTTDLATDGGRPARAMPGAGRTAPRTLAKSSHPMPSRCSSPPNCSGLSYHVRSWPVWSET